jgi:hypothetical protein
VVAAPLDSSALAQSRSLAWQKCLVLSQELARAYRQVALLDSDIVINHEAAPNIFEQVTEEFIGGVISGSHIQEDLRVVMLSRLLGKQFPYERGLRHWEDDQRSLYQPFGLTPIDGGIVQTGVLVASPQQHGELFLEVYQSRYPVKSRTHEQIPLSHAILSSGLFRPIDPRFNSVFYETMLVHYPYLLDDTTPAYSELAKRATRTQFANNFFLHFAYDSQFIRFLSD